VIALAVCIAVLAGSIVFTVRLAKFIADCDAREVDQ
jgi:glycerol-3-phosphate acyltransferase PlsY